MTAVVFNAAYNGLGIVRELGRNGVDVYVLDSFRNVGTVSRSDGIAPVRTPKRTRRRS